MNTDNECHASFYVVDISPSEKLQLAGFGKREEKATLGIPECKLRILWIKDRFGSDFVIFSADLLYFPNSLANALSDFLLAEHNIPKNQLLFTATHTHSAPTFGYFSNDDPNDEYFTYAAQKTIEHIQTTPQTFSSFSIHHQQVNLEKRFAVNRRKLTLDPRSFFLKKKILSLPNLDNSVDINLDILTFCDTTGKPWTSLIIFPCHPVLNTNYSISSDFPGTIIKTLARNNICPNSMYLQGFGGDLRPAITRRLPQTNSSLKVFCKDLLKLALFKQIFSRCSTSEYKDFTSSLFEEITSAIQTSIQTPKLELNLNFSTELLPIHSESGRTKKDLAIQKIEFDNSLSLVSVSAEVFYEYSELLNQKEGQKVIPISITDNVIGYLPSIKEAGFGGYEVNQAAINAGWDTIISKESLKDFEEVLSKLSGNKHKPPDQEDRSKISTLSGSLP